MLLSGIGPKTHLDEFGITQILDLPGVGENLRDHPAAFVLYRGDSEQPDIDAPNIQIGLRISPEGSTTEADLQISPILMSSEHAPSSVVIESDDFHFGISFALQNALGKGRLRLASADPAQQPIINYNYLSDPFDRQQMRHGLRMALEIAAESPFKEYIIERINPTESDLVSDSSIDDWLLRNVYTQHHSSGTCKMGDSSDPMAVVDQYSHVHGIENLRIVDASNTTDVIRANTNATTIMIAERVADWIKQGI
jgi:choline dehydrogenase